jgi:hypothetical protein
MLTNIYKQKPSLTKSRNTYNKIKLNSTKQIQSDIKTLFSQYQTLRKKRINIEKNQSMLEKRIKLLNSSQVKLKNQSIQEERKQSKHNSIRKALLQQKNLLTKNKKQEIKQIQKKKKSNSIQKEAINNTLTTWRIKVSEKNKKEGNKVKAEKEEISKIIYSFKKEDFEHKQQLHNQIQKEKYNGINNKKIAQQKRQNSIKINLQGKINKEKVQINELHKHIRHRKCESENIIRRINNIKK